MRKTKVKLLKKNAVLSLAVLLLSTGSVFAASSWGDLQTEVNNVQQGGTVTITGPIDANRTPLNLGAPPVPGVTTPTFTINGGGNTITAQPQNVPPSDPRDLSQIIVNSGANNVVIENTNMTGATGDTGGAIQNAGGTGGAERTAGGNLTVQGTGTNRVQISGNTAGKGGAAFNLGTLNISNVDFTNNHAVDASYMPNNDGTYGRGGVIYNGSESAEGTVNIYNSLFTDNSSNGEGDRSSFSGVIHNRAGNVTIHNSIFGTEGHGNSSGTSGGAIVNQDSLTIYDSSFSYNHTTTMGGAILNGLDARANAVNAISNINNTMFVGNYADLGAAIYNTTSMTDGFKNEVNINDGTTFSNNGVLDGDNTKVTNNGGAIYNDGKSSATSADGILNINKDGNNRTVVFENNVAKTGGGAIHNKGTASINNTLFVNNGVSASAPDVVTQFGGAVYNTNSVLGGSGKLEVSNSSFVGNTAQYGGAIYNTSANDVKTTITIKDSSFSGNKSVTTAGVIRPEQGGAIYANNNTVTNIVSENSNVNIGQYGTSLQDGTDTIKLVGNAELNLESTGAGVINLNSTIYGDAQTNSVNANGGQINVNAPIRNSTININGGMMKFEHDRYLAGQKELTDTTSLNKLVLNGGTLNLLNNEFVDQLRASSLALTSNSNIMLDVDLANEKMDSILQNNFGSVTVDGDSILNISQMKSVTEAKGDNATILFTDAPALIGHVTNNGASVVEAPIYKYAVTQVTQSGGTGPLGPEFGDGEYFQFQKMGNSDSIIAGPVAAQAAFLIMDNLYRQSFANMDMVTLMSPEQRMAWKMRNKYASAGYHTGVYAPNVIPEERDGWYMRPFTNFENVPLKNGPKVSNVSYGTLIGGESDLIDLGHGWDGNFSFFGAYHGSHQAYNGIGIWQNGGTLGAVGTAYKGNFWTGVTANVGASAAEASTMFGHDNFPILMTGAAWKSGYNWGLLKNKLIIQPSYMMSYTFVNVFDYTTASGIKVTQDPLNAIEIIPGLRIIGNLKNGWQPYLAFNMTWNIMDKTKFYAAEVPLSQLSVKPYFEYGAGLQKRYGDRFTGFGQAMLRNGGRNGIALTLGFRWALGN